MRNSSFVCNHTPPFASTSVYNCFIHIGAYPCVYTSAPSRICRCACMYSQKYTIDFCEYSVRMLAQCTVPSRCNGPERGKRVLKKHRVEVAQHYTLKRKYYLKEQNNSNVTLCRTFRVRLVESAIQKSPNKSFFFTPCFLTTGGHCICRCIHASC